MQESSALTCNRADDGNFVAFKRPHSNSAVRGDLSTVKSACTELAPCHTRAVNVLEGLVIFLEYSRHGMCYLLFLNVETDVSLG